MKKIKSHFIKKLEVSIIKFKNTIGNKFKVTKRIPDFSVAETKIFKSRKKAIRQFKEWLK